MNEQDRDKLKEAVEYYKQMEWLEEKDKHATRIKALCDLAQEILEGKWVEKSEPQIVDGKLADCIGQFMGERVKLRHWLTSDLARYLVEHKGEWLHE